MRIVVIPEHVRADLVLADKSGHNCDFWGWGSRSDGIRHPRLSDKALQDLFIRLRIVVGVAYHPTGGTSQQVPLENLRSQLLVDRLYLWNF